MKLNRREFVKSLALGAGALALPAGVWSGPVGKRPNVLVFVADDMTWAHTSFAGCTFARTPNFDRLAREGMYFENAFSAAPICTPTRGSLLTGLQPWQLGEGIQLLSTLPAQLVTYPNHLAQHGYFTGSTGKGWGPGNWGASGRTVDPAGPGFWGAKLKQTPSTGIHHDDLPGNFRRFLREKPADQPFCFWFGSNEPHVPYEDGSGIRAGLKPETVVVPPFLPDTPEVRSDLLDYALEIEFLDAQIGQCRAALEETGLLENTLIIVVGDNGMPFPAAKHTCYEYGVRVPLVMRWGKGIPAGQRVTGCVSTPDLTATIYAATGVTPPRALPGANLLRQAGHDHVILAHERGNLCREGDVGYPMRAIRTDRYLYIRNYAPDRWPAGDPPVFMDVDPLTMKPMLIERRDDSAIRPFYERAMGMRPADELYDVQADPGCLKNLAADRPALVVELRKKMEAQLRADGDYRVLGEGDKYDQMPPRAGKRVKPAGR